MSKWQSFASGSNYCVLDSTCDVLILRDLGPWDKFKTITNNAERVLAELYDQGFLANSKRRVFYYDSEDNYDELLWYGNGQFYAFKAARKP